MSRFATKQELVDDAEGAWVKLQALLSEIPVEAKTIEVMDGMTVKDFLAHRAEWGRMAIGWYETARGGGTPDVPAPGYGWGQLKGLNAEIHDRFADIPLPEAEAGLTASHEALMAIIEGCSEDELFTKQYYSFTG